LLRTGRRFSAILATCWRAKLSKPPLYLELGVPISLLATSSAAFFHQVMVKSRIPKLRLPITMSMRVDYRAPPFTKNSARTDQLPQFAILASGDTPLPPIKYRRPKNLETIGDKDGAFKCVIVRFAAPIAKI
jgi:hypothetical protein